MRIRCDYPGCDGTGFLWGPYCNCPKCHGAGVIRAADEDSDFMDEPYSEEERKAQDDERWSREER